MTPKRLGPKKFLIQKSFATKNLVKNICVKKKLRSQKICLVKIWSLTAEIFLICTNPVHEVHTEGEGEGEGNRSSYLKMDLKSDFFDFFQSICFWKAEPKKNTDS